VETVGKHINAGKDVVLAMHSYGGVSGCQAMEHIMNNNKGGNGKGRVLRTVWIAGFVPKEGGSLRMTVGKDQP
jgi:hypothetical protein